MRRRARASRSALWCSFRWNKESLPDFFSDRLTPTDQFGTILGDDSVHQRLQFVTTPFTRLGVRKNSCSARFRIAALAACAFPTGHSIKYDLSCERCQMLTTVVARDGSDLVRAVREPPAAKLRLRKIYAIELSVRVVREGPLSRRMRSASRLPCMIAASDFAAATDFA